MANRKANGTSSALKYTTIGVSLASIAAGAYFLLGSKAKQRQNHAKAWVIKMKGDVIEKLESAKEVTEPIYNAIIDTVASNYAKKIKDSEGDLSMIVGDLKKQWKTLSKALKPKKVARKATSAKKKK